MTTAMPDFAIKAFDKAAKETGMSNGNIISDCQVSLYIRAANRTDCNGFLFEPGYLRNADLSQFGNASPIPSQVRRVVLAKSETDSVVLARFGYWTQKVYRLVGWVVTTPNGQVLGRFPVLTPKKVQTFNQALAYLNYC